MTTSKKKLPLGNFFLAIMTIIIIYMRFKPITLEGKVTIEAGQNVSKIFKQLNIIENLRTKFYIKRNNIDFSKLEAGDYIFTGKYTTSKLIKTIIAWPEKKYIRVTILEGRSIYDIDQALTKKWYSTGGEYISLATNQIIINTYQKKYPFLANPTSINTLEGFLYPDTYHLDKNKNVVDQLIYAQLENFNTKVWKKISSPNQRYQTIILASILEKEERNNDNKPTVAGIFLKRLDIWMKIDADITLCYGLKTSYTDCTPSVIAKSVSDKNNIYNTRQQYWLPPTPIANPSRESIYAILNPQASNNIYYLHDMQGNIHYGKTLEEHNENKKNYLK